MATFKTEYHGVSHGPAEFFAADGVIEIPDEYVPAFTAMIASGELVAVEAAPAEGDAKSLDADAPKGEVKPDEYVPAFTAMIASGELVAVEAAPAEGDAKSLDADAPKGEVKPDEPKGDAEEPKKKGKKE